MIILTVILVFYFILGVVFFTLDVLEKEVVGKSLLSIAFIYFIVFPSMLLAAMFCDTLKSLRGKNGKKSV